MSDGPGALAQRRDRLQALRDRFLALSLRSRTLRLLRPSKSGALDLARLGGPSLAWLVKVLGGPADPPVKPGAIADVASDSPLSEDVATLAHAARAVLMETGADELAVGFPFLEGKTPDGTWLRAPLFLYPCAIGQTRTGKLRWTLQPTGPAYLNESLCETLRRLAGVRLEAEDFTARDEDALFKVDSPTWQAIVDTLRAAGLAIDAPLALPDAPSPLEPRDEAARAAVPSGQLGLRFHLVLGRFPAAASTLVLDYDLLLEGALDDAALGLAAPILAVDEAESGASGEAVAAEPAPAPASGALGPLRRWQVLPSDKSQDDVFRFLEAPAQGDARGLVVQGPPGTGKSQLITNLLAAGIAEGQRVLLVCQKRAALDVVAERLERLGLREPIAVVHDVERDRNALYQSIGETLTRLLDEAGADVDQAKVLAEVDKAAARAGKDLGARLAASQAAWDELTREDGRPALVALDEALLDHDEALPDLAPHLSGVGLDELPEGLRAVEAFAPLAAPYAPPHAYAERGDWSAHGATELATLNARMARARESLGLWQTLAHAGSLPAASLDGERYLVIAAAPLAALGSDADRRGAHASYESWRRLPSPRPPEELARTLRTARQSLPPVPPELVAARPETIDKQLRKLERLAELERHWWRVFLPAFWLLRSLPRRILATLARPPSLGPTPTLDLAQLHRDARRWHALLPELPEHPSFHLARLGDPAALDPPIVRLEAGLAIEHAAAALSRAFASEGAPWTTPAALASDGGPSALALAVGAELPRAQALAALAEGMAALAPDFEPAFLEGLRRLAVTAPAEAAERLDALLASAPEALACAELDRMLAPLPAFARAFLRRHRDDDPERARASAVRAVQLGWRSLRLAGRDAAALERPLLDPKLTAGLAGALESARGVAAKGAAARWLGRLHDAAGDPAARKELQKLLGEVQKKRHRATLRQLQERYGARLGLVRPIWFCSPESVASLFPLEPGLFDLVIFDEASQCPVESAVPALVRGARALVAGDDQQMPPSHFFQASADDDVFEPDESALLAAQSILGLARVALRTTTLSWHYRCRHEALIAFSNAAYYGRRLATAPNAERRPRLASEGLHWEAVAGRWKEQTNLVEAERVVALVGQILAESLPSGEPPTLGIVAMNRPQAELISQRLEARAADDEAFRAILVRDLERPVIDQLFVRNLENVQGDERDVMILSLAYGPSEAGGKVYARFGPLGLEGGEKRLNVAITRARLGLWVVASCTPEDLAVEGTTHPGPKLLKAFLAFVRAAARGETGAQEHLLEEAAALGQGKASQRAAPSARPGTKLRDAIARALEARGHVVQRDLGLGRLSLDLAVRAADDDAFRVGLDTSGYLGRPDPLMRELYVPAFWQRVGWRLVRVTPGAWRRDRKGIITAIEKALG